MGLNIGDSTCQIMKHRFFGLREILLIQKRKNRFGRKVKKLEITLICISGLTLFLEILISLNTGRKMVGKIYLGKENWPWSLNFSVNQMRKQMLIGILQHIKNLNMVLLLVVGKWVSVHGANIKKW